ncbi:MAG: uroporphyrinogen-III synthase [Sphingomicrobium sp.]
MRRLTILRPEPGASASLAIARELAIHAVSHPLFAIERLAWEAPEAAGYDGLLLTSANAVRSAGDGLTQLRGLKVYAVGEATAEAARNAGFDIAGTGSAGAEQLLGSIAGGQKLLHLCGEDRAEIGDGPHEIAHIPVYRSAELPPPEGLSDAEVVAVHSPRAARRFAELVLERSRIAVAAISAAAAEGLGEGWLQVVVAECPDDRSLLVLAKELCDKPA